jgi:hypothetical protein
MFLALGCQGTPAVGDSSPAQDAFVDEPVAISVAVGGVT